MKKGLFLRKVFIPGLVLAFVLSALIAGCSSAGGSNVEKKSVSVSGKGVQAGVSGAGTLKNDEAQGETVIQETDTPEPVVTAGNDGAVNNGAETGRGAAAQSEVNVDVNEDVQGGVNADGNEDVQSGVNADGTETVQVGAKPGAQTGEKTVAGTGEAAASARVSAEITSQPSNVFVVEGDTAVFKIGARGDGLAWQWQCRESADRNWRKSLSPGADSASLQVEGRKEHSGFQFRCVVTDDQGGSVASEAASLSVLAITKQATGENIKKGSSTSFIIRATGRDLSYEWERMKPSGEECEKYGSGNTEPTLKIKDASTAWNGCKYRCKITDPEGNTVYSDPVTLYVLGISSQPADKSIKNTGDGSFRVAATGKNIKYLWQYRRQSDDDWKEYKASSNSRSVLKITKAGLELNRAQFRCRITDADGKKIYSESAMLYVFGIRKHPTAEYVKKGKTAVFKVLACGRNLKYRWQKKKVGDSDWSNSSSEGNKSATLRIDNVAAGLNGMKFRCIVSDAEGRKSYSKGAALHVLVVTKSPSRASVRAGNTATFVVKARGGGLKYSWQVKESSAHEWRESISSGHNSSVLKVYGGRGRSGYKFRCKVSDAAGNVVYSNPAVLYVSCILKNPSLQMVKTGTRAVFHVKASGYKLKYSWQVRESSDADWRDSISSGHRTSTLRIAARIAYHGYRFRCKVTDGNGRVFYSKAAMLSVLGIRSQPYDQSVDKGHTAVFRVRASGAGLHYQWQVKEHSGGWRNSTSTGNRSSVLKVKGLMSRDGFRFRCRVRDKKGNTVYSEPAYLWVFNSEELFFDTYE